MRLPNWRSRLIAYLEAHRDKPFAYGVHDCCLFAAGAVEAVTGVDPAASYRGRYTTARGGLRVLRADGFDDQFSFIADLYPEIGALRAQAGDLASVVGALGVVAGPHVFVLREEGLGLVRLTEIDMAFHVK